jgi:hypothetical protein
MSGNKIKILKQMFQKISMVSWPMIHKVSDYEYPYWKLWVPLLKIMSTPTENYDYPYWKLWLPLLKIMSTPT